MSHYWPSGLELSDTQSPKEILKVAQEDWHTNGNGVVELILQDAKSESGNSMIIVHAKHVPSNRTCRLFSIVHRPNTPYPVTIQPEDDDLPSFLRKTSIPSRDELDQIIAGTAWNNKWVSDTPAEFREKLSEMFNRGVTKSLVLNLISNASQEASVINGEASEDTLEG